jgi:hypothetical protein
MADFDSSAHMSMVNNAFANALKSGTGDGAGKGDSPWDAIVAASKTLTKYLSGWFGQFFGAEGNVGESLSHNSYIVPDTQGFAPKDGKDTLGLLTMLMKNVKFEFHAQTDGIQIAHVDTNIPISPPHTPGMSGGHGGGIDFHG